MARGKRRRDTKKSGKREKDKRGMRNIRGRREKEKDRISLKSKATGLLLVLKEVSPLIQKSFISSEQLMFCCSVVKRSLRHLTSRRVISILRVVTCELLTQPAIM